MKSQARFKKKTASEKGFTLIEMLVVVTIVALLSVLAIAAFRQGQKKYVLVSAKQGFVGAVRQAQSFATSGAEIPGYETAGGFGVYASDSRTYIVFFNTNTTSKQYDASSVALSTITLPENVIFGGGIGDSVFFVPPTPITYLNGSTEIPSIGFSFFRDGSSELVTIFSYGRIDY